jgi:multiple sugar transport system substrate-binding protein
MAMSRRHFLGTAVALAAARAGAAAAQQATTLTASFSYGPYRPMFEEIARRFEAEQPGVRITYRSPVMDTHEEHLQQVLRGAMTNDVPDVSFQGNHLIGVLVQRGLPVALDPFIARDAGWPAVGAFASAQQVGEVDGASYGLAFQTSVPTIFYNAELVRRAGGDPGRLPETWPAVVDLAQRIAALGGGVMGGFFDYDASGNYTFQAFVHGLGGRMMTPGDREIAFDGREGMAALEVLKQFAADAGMQDMTRNQAYQAFSSGTIGVMPSASSNLGQFERQAGERFAVLTGPWPVMPPNGQLPAGGRTAMIFTRDPAKQQAAWAFIKFALGARAQTIMVEQTGSLPNNQIALNDPDLLGRFYEQRPNQMTSVRQLPALGRFFSFPGENAVRIVGVVTDHLRTVVNRQREPAAAMEAMVRDVRALLPVAR